MGLQCMKPYMGATKCVFGASGFNRALYAIAHSTLPRGDQTSVGSVEGLGELNKFATRALAEN